MAGYKDYLRAMVESEPARMAGAAGAGAQELIGNIGRYGMHTLNRGAQIVSGSGDSWNGYFDNNEQKIDDWWDNPPVLPDSYNQYRQGLMNEHPGSAKAGAFLVPAGGIVKGTSMLAKMANGSDTVRKVRQGIDTAKKVKSGVQKVQKAKDLYARYNNLGKDPKNGMSPAAKVVWAAKRGWLIKKLYDEKMKEFTHFEKDPQYSNVVEHLENYRNNLNSGYEHFLKTGDEGKIYNADTGEKIDRITKALREDG